MHIDGSKARAIKRRGHLHLPIHALLAQNGNSRPRCMHKRRIHPLGPIERHANRKSGPLGILQQRELLPRALRIVAQRLNMKARLRPHRVQCGARVVIRNLAAAVNRNLVARHAASNHLSRKASDAQPRKHLGDILRSNLHHRAQFFAE